MYTPVNLQKLKFSDIKLLYSFHISAQNIDCWYSLELPQWGSSNEYPLSVFWADIRKIMYTPVNLQKLKFSDKKLLYFFHISAQNIDCWYSLEPPRQGSSEEYPLSVFWADIRKTMYTTVNLQNWNFQIFIYLIWVLRPFQEYFTYIEQVVHQRWAKTGEPGEKPPDHS